MTRMSREDCGNLVFEALNDGDYTKAEVCEVTGLTPSQFNSGLAYIKDILAEESGTPIRTDPSTHRYSLDLSGDEDKNRAYQGYRLRIARKQLTRLATGTASPAVALYGTPASRRLLRYVLGAIDEIDILVTELDGSPGNGRAAS